MRTREQRRTSLVRELLDGGDVDLAQVDYRIADRRHVAIVATGAGAADAVRELARRLGRPLLLIDWPPRAAGPGSAGRARSTSRVRRRRCWRGAASRTGCASHSARRPRASTGSAARIRRPPPRSVRRSRRTHLSRTTTTSCWRSSPQAVEIRARRFAERELAGLGGTDARSRRLRATLAAYFAHEQNAAATAAALGVRADRREPAQGRAAPDWTSRRRPPRRDRDGAAAPPLPGRRRRGAWLPRSGDAGREATA